jgi:hypothetical protein
MRFGLLSVAFEGLDRQTTENSSVVLPMNFLRPAGLMDTPMSVLVWDLSGAEPTAVTVDLLARLALALRREGSRLQLSHASFELVELIEFMGLSDVLVVEPGR